MEFQLSSPYARFLDRDRMTLYQLQGLFKGVCSMMFHELTYEVFPAIVVFWDATLPCWVIPDVSEERIAFIFQGFSCPRRIPRG